MVFPSQNEKATGKGGEKLDFAADLRRLALIFRLVFGV
jgi:hypothetical protein